MTVTAPSTRLDETLSRVEAELARWHVPGLELAVVADGGTVFAGGFGGCGVDDPAPVAASTLFHHGSCGKAYTGLLATLLAEEGRLDLDEPVRRQVPELRLPDPFIADRVTVRDLLSHRSGLGRHDLAWIFNPSWSRAELIARMEHLPLTGDLRATWSYSNLGYALAGEVIGRVTGSSWEEQLRRRVFDVLGMRRSTNQVQDLIADADAARPHIVRDGTARRTLHRILDAAAPAGEVISCADDSLRWLHAQLGDGPLSADAVRSTQQPQMLLPPGVTPFPEFDFVGYGFGWISGTYRGRPLVWHNGGVDGFTTYTVLLPAQRIGLLASANVFPTDLPFATVLALADALICEVSEPSWFDRLHPDQAAKGDGAAAPAPPAPRSAAGPVAAPPPSHELAAYAGRFRHLGFGDLRVGVAEGELTARLGEFDVEARHRHYDTWDLHYDPLDVDLTMTFETGADGCVVGVSALLDDGSGPLRFGRVESEE
ncbi:MAG TPA: serine hydrolase [Mycobacteriales bacterium]|nr:serine hydrolase [Mycobacteriales bacterium]